MKLMFLTLLALCLAVHLGVARETFQTPGNGQHLGVWRITNEPEARHWANYHNTRCWSADGRYLCFTREAEEKLGAEVFLYDAHLDATRRVEAGALPRWAHQRNWLFYRHLRRDENDSLVSEIVWLDVDAGTRRILATIPGEVELGEPESRDEWLYGGRLERGKEKANGIKKERSGLRIRIAEKPEVQPLPQVQGYQFMPNPVHPLFFTRWKGDRSDFTSSRLWYDLDGTHERTGIPMLQNAHTAWLGNGEYHLMGNGLVRGRRWSEPFPSDLHILAAVSVGDVSPCGGSGRFATGDHTLADLRSGDGWMFIHPLSHICFPTETGDASTIFDADPKGSPDGTKVAFVTNYDLKDGPFTLLAEDAGESAEVLQVASTARFPEQGEILLKTEIVAYERKTATTFEGLRRGLHGTQASAARAGAEVTSFAARLLTDEQWQRIGAKASDAMRSGVRGGDAILLRQRQTDVHVVVVRNPQPPSLRLVAGKVQLIPAEEHCETHGYHLLRNGQRVTAKPLRLGESLQHAEAGDYAAVAVEWSGLESAASPVLRLTQAAGIDILKEKPEDFQWTRDRWMVAGREVPAADATQAVEATREVVHLHDGVIHREQHERGVLVRREDLNAEGKTIRELLYREGKLAQRQYTDRTGVLVSRELFSAEGFISESVFFDRRIEPGAAPRETDHWWYDHGMPVKQVKEGRTFTRSGDNWVSDSGSKPATKKKQP